MRTKHTVKIEEEELFYHPGSLSKQNHSAENPLRIKWSVEESYIYMTYLRLFADNFRRPKFFKPFVRMSKLITTRSSRQIKSHHQKMLLKYQSISQIVREVELFLDYQEERLKLSLVEQLAQRFEPLFHAEQQYLSYGIHNKPRKVKNKKEVNKEQSIGQSQGMKVKCEEKQAQIYHFEQSKSEEEPVQQ